MSDELHDEKDALRQKLSEYSVALLKIRDLIDGSGVVSETKVLEIINQVLPDEI